MRQRRRHWGEPQCLGCHNLRLAGQFGDRPQYVLVLTDFLENIYSSRPILSAAEVFDPVAASDLVKGGKP